MEEEIKNGEVTFIYTGIIRRNKEKIIYVRFERDGKNGNVYAEGTLPACKITNQKGFSAEEVGLLEQYLSVNCDEVFEKASALEIIKNL